MPVIRQQNWLGQQRIDVPHLRSVESSTAADFDLLAGKIIAGKTPLVVSGFNVITLPNGSPATSLQVQVASAVVLHPLAAESGTIFQVPASRAAETLNASNARVVGSFTSNAVNYISIDLRRTADASTADLVQFLVANTNTESPKDVPLGRTLDYIIYISAQDFTTTPSLAPLAKVTTDANNNITKIEDARNFFLRLGSGGSITDPKHAYGWPGGRTEVGDNSDFSAADKSIGSLKEWLDAAMTRMWELGGGEHWYSPTADRNVIMMRTGATMADGEYFTWNSGTSTLTWQGLRMVFDNSTATYNTITDNALTGVVLADGDCLYVDVNRYTNAAVLTAVKGTLSTLGTPAIPGSRYVIAWRSGTQVFTRGSSFPVGATFNPATNTSLGIVQLSYAAGTPSTPKVAPQDANGTISNTATAGNNPGFLGTGIGSGVGVRGVGGATGSGGSFTAGGGNTDGLTGAGSGSGAGVSGSGGATGPGASFVGGATAGDGVQGLGTGAGYGVNATGGSGGGAGVSGTGGGGGSGVVGTGGATNGVGVRGQGTAAGAGGDFTPGTTGVGLIVHEVSGNRQPQATFRNLANISRSHIDHNGYQGLGRYYHFHEDWSQQFQSAANSLTASQTPMASNPRWSLVIASTATFQSPISGGTYDILATYPGPYRVLVTSASASSQCIVHSWGGVNATGMVLNPDFTGLDFVMEWDAWTNVAGADNVDIEMGLKYNSTAGSAAILFKHQSTNANPSNWYCYTNNGAAGTNNLDSTVPMSSSPAQRFRIEIHGSATSYGTKTVLFFINGALVQTMTTNLPAGFPIGPHFMILANAGSLARDLKLGPVDIRFNRFASPDSL